MSYAEIDSNTFTLRALNDAKSTYAAVEFHESFFDGFQLANNLNTFSCKVNVKVNILATSPYLP